MVNDKKTAYTIEELSDSRFDFAHQEIIDNLLNDSIDDFVKIFSIINLEAFESKDDIFALIKNLTNHPTPIREAAALKLEELYQDEYYDNKIKDIILSAIIDINPNVCRAVCLMISKSLLLKQELLNDLILRINQLLIQINENNLQLGGFYEDESKIRKNHAKNKKLFSLYWYLEALSFCNCNKNNSEVLEILKQTIKFNDYTIREKTVKVLVKLDNPPNDLLQIAKRDQNFYVKNQVYDKINIED